MRKYLLYFILLIPSIFLRAGQLERDLVGYLKEGNEAKVRELIASGANPSIAMVEAEFLGPPFSDFRNRLQNYGGNWAEATKEREKIVDNLNNISDVVKSAKLTFYRKKDNKEYFMIAPDPSKNPQPLSGDFGAPFFKKPKNLYKYLTWIQGQPDRQEWISIADFVRQGYGILGLAKNLLDTNMMDVIAFHPEAKTSANYLFDLIHAPLLSQRNEYQIGLLLGYWEPDVYAWSFGTDAAIRAYPNLVLDPDRPFKSHNGYPDETKVSLRKLGKRGLDFINPKERQRVLHELAPQDDQFVSKDE